MKRGQKEQDSYDVSFRLLLFSDRNSWENSGRILLPSVIFYTVKIEKVFNELALAPPLDGTDGSFWEISTFTIGILQMPSEFP